MWPLKAEIRLRFLVGIFIMVDILYWKHSNDFSLAWFSKRMVVGITAFCGLVIALVLSAILKAFDIASSPPRTVWRPVNVRHRYANLDEPEDPHHPAASASYAAGALFGRKPWQEKLPCVSSSQWNSYIVG